MSGTDLFGGDIYVRQKVGKFPHRVDFLESALQSELGDLM